VGGRVARGRVCIVAMGIGVALSCILPHIESLLRRSSINHIGSWRECTSGLWKTRIADCSCQRHISVRASTASRTVQHMQVTSGKPNVIIGAMERLIVLDST
jgi:hypothetical protein